MALVIPIHPVLLGVTALRRLRPVELLIAKHRDRVGKTVPPTVKGSHLEPPKEPQAGVERVILTLVDPNGPTARDAMSARPMDIRMEEVTRMELMDP